MSQQSTKDCIHYTTPGGKYCHDCGAKLEPEASANTASSLALLQDYFVEGHLLTTSETTTKDLREAVKFGYDARDEEVRGLEGRASTYRSGLGEWQNKAMQLAEENKRLSEANMKLREALEAICRMSKGMTTRGPIYRTGLLALKASEP